LATLKEHLVTLKRVATPGLRTADVSDNASFFINEKLKRKIAKWGTPRKYLSKFHHFILFFESPDIQCMFCLQKLLFSSFPPKQKANLLIINQLTRKIIFQSKLGQTTN
jgi:hypothetical protein